MNSSKTVLIIGGGVIGLSTAYYAAKWGHRVTVMDRNPEQRDGCSFGNAGLVVPSHFVPLAAPGMVALGLKWMWSPESPFYIKPRLDRELLDWSWKFWRASTREHVRRAAPLLRDLNLASRACFEELSNLPNTDFGLAKRGLLVLCKTQHALDEEAKTVAQARSLGMAASVLDAKQTAALDPNVRMDVAGSVHFPMDCHLSPNRFMASLKAECDRLGVTFLWNTDIQRINCDGSRVTGVQACGGEHSADEFILCAGCWSSGIAQELGLRIPMQAGKGYSLTLPKPPVLPALPALCNEARVAVTPMGGALRFAGTMEIAGLNEEINPVRVGGIIKSISKYYPEFTSELFKAVSPWRGLRPCSPDGLPYVGRPGSFKNLIIATGHAMMGLSLGPITGKLVAEIVSGTNLSITIELLNPDRYA